VWATVRADGNVAGTDDLLTPEEIEALMSAARSSAPTPSFPSPASKTAASASPVKRPSVPVGNPEHLLQEAENQLAAALASDFGGQKGPPSAFGAPSAYQFDDLLNAPAAAGTPHPLSALEDVELDLRIELGRTELLIEEVLQLREGTVVPLDKLAGDPVDIYVNGRLIARGEVLVLNDNFCVRVAEILAPEL
jgi:flagellar motor switch protein FliN/FliY